MSSNEDKFKAASGPEANSNSYKGHIVILSDDYLTSDPRKDDFIQKLLYMPSTIGRAWKAAKDNFAGKTTPLENNIEGQRIRSGVDNTLVNTKKKSEEHGYRVSVIYNDHNKFWVVNWLPKHPEIDIAVLPKSRAFSVGRQLDALDPDYIYIATPEGTIGAAGVMHCNANNWNYTSGVHTRFHDYVANMNVPILSPLAKKFGGQFLRLVNRGGLIALWF